MKLELCRYIFEKYSSVKCHEYPPSGSRVFRSYRRTDGGADRRTDRVKLVVACRNFADASNTRWTEPYVRYVENEPNSLGVQAVCYEADLYVMISIYVLYIRIILWHFGTVT